MAAFKGEAKCTECGEIKMVHANVRKPEYTVDECPECGVTDVLFEVIDTVEPV